MINEADSINLFISRRTEAKEKSAITESVWSKIKTRNDFTNFISALAAYEIDIEQLELIYDPEELTRAYTDWRQGQGINL